MTLTPLPLSGEVEPAATRHREPGNVWPDESIPAPIDLPRFGSPRPICVRPAAKPRLPDPHFVTKDRVDGRTFTTTGHALGDRTLIVLDVAERYLRPDGAQALTRRGPSDFERRETIRYRTSGGAFEISYANGFPVGRFVAAAAPPTYPDHQDLSFVLNRDGERRPIRTTADWHDRRDHVLAHFQRATGLLPSPTRRVPLNAKVIEQVRIGTLLRRKLTYQSDPDDRVAAYLFLPSTPQSALPTQHSPVGLPAVLCLQQTTAVGKDEPAGVRGDPSLKYALELAERGHNGLFTAVFDERIKALVTSCGFTSLERDDIPSWTGPRYMPRLASEFKNDPKLVPFDFHELVACLAPRAVFVSAATRDDDFDVAGVREVLAAAGTIYRLRGAEDKVQVHFPDAPHSFPESARRQAYEFLDRQLAR